MAKGRLTSAFLVALSISAGCTFLLSKKLRVHAQSSVIEKQGYVAAAVPLEAGQVLKAEDLKMIEWPTSIPLAGGFPNAKVIVGRAVMYPLSANSPILDRDLSTPGMGLTVKIPDGMRALALRSDEVVGVAGFLFPGSHVDVLVTYRSDKSPEPSTATVLEDAEVLAAGHQAEPDPSGKPAQVNVVTLLVSPDDAERAVLASTQGSIHFVLRNGSDHGHVNDAPVELSQLVQSSSVIHGTARKQKALRPQPYVVETVMGNKQSVTSFN